MHIVCHFECVYSKLPYEVVSILIRINTVQTLKPVYFKVVFVRSEWGIRHPAWISHHLISS